MTVEVSRRQFLETTKDVGIKAGKVLLAGKLASLLAACEEDEKLDLTTPIKLPELAEPQTIHIKETLRRPTGHVYAEIIEKGGNYNQYDRGKARLAVYYVEEKTGQRSLLSREVDNPNNRYYSFSLSPDGKTVALGVESPGAKPFKTLSVKIIDIAGGAEKRLEGSLQIYEGVTPRVDEGVDLQWSHDGAYLSSSQLRTIWEARSGKVVYEDKEKEESYPRGIEGLYSGREFLWSPTKNRVLVDTRVPSKVADRILDLDKRQEEVIGNFFWYNSDLMIAGGRTQWSPDGERLALASYAISPDRSTMYITTGDGRLLNKFQFDAPIRDLTWSPDGEHIACLLDRLHITTFGARELNPHLLILNIRTGKQIVIPLIPTPQVSLEYIESVSAAGGEIKWGENNTLFVLLPQITRWSPVRYIPSVNPDIFRGVEFIRDPEGSAPPPQIKAAFLPVDERFVKGEINVRDGKLGEGKEAIVGTGFADIYRKSEQPTGGEEVILRASPHGDLGDYDLYRVDTIKREMIHVGKGVGLNIRTEILEAELSVTEGDMIKVRERHYRLVHGEKYPIRNVDLVTRNSNFRGRTVMINERSAQDLPEIAVSPEDFILDWAGRLTARRKDGGLKNCFAAGLLTGAAIIELDKTFRAIRDQLKQNEYDDLDSLFYTYNKEKQLVERMFGYRYTDTMQDPLESIQLADELLTQWEKDYPLENFNLFGHSLGGVILLHAAYKHLPRIRNIFLFDAPINGLPPNLPRNVTRFFAENFLGGGKVISFLLKAWKSQEYQKRVQEIVEAIKAEEIGFLPWASTDDGIVPWEAAIPKGMADVVTIKGKPMRLRWAMGRSGNLGHDHGRVLDNNEVKENTAFAIGQNLATSTS